MLTLLAYPVTFSGSYNKRRALRRRPAYCLVIEADAFLNEVVQQLKLTAISGEDVTFVGYWWTQDLARKAGDLIAKVADTRAQYVGMLPYPGPNESDMEEAMYLVGSSVDSPWNNLS